MDGEEIKIKEKKKGTKSKGKGKPEAVEIPAAPDRILVVDDEAAIGEFLQDVLNLHGYAVDTLQNPVEALQKVSREDYDLVLTDLIMPKIDGIALTNAIKEMGVDTPVVVMTGFASIDYAVESMKAGAADFITKPINLDHVLLIIKRVLENRRIMKMAREGEYYKRISNLDPLTAIGNYRFLEQVLPIELERHKRHNRKLALMIIDIDDFKKYNDTYGHLSGDLILVQVASLLKKSVRNCDFVIRYGGEEFIVVLPEIDPQRARHVGERILRNINHFTFTTPEGLSIGRISVTIGMSTFPKDAEQRKDLMKKADDALYFGKRNGKNSLCLFGEPIDQIHAHPARHSATARPKTK